MDKSVDRSIPDTIKALLGVLWVLFLAVPLVVFGREIMNIINSVFGVNMSSWSLRFVFVVFAAVGVKVIFLEVDNKYR